MEKGNGEKTQKKNMQDTRHMENWHVILVLIVAFSTAAFPSICFYAAYYKPGIHTSQSLGIMITVIDDNPKEYNKTEFTEMAGKPEKAGIYIFTPVEEQISDQLRFYYQTYGIDIGTGSIITWELKKLDEVKLYPMGGKRYIGSIHYTEYGVKKYSLSESRICVGYPLEGDKWFHDGWSLVHEEPVTYYQENEMYVTVHHWQRVQPLAFGENHIEIS